MIPTREADLYAWADNFSTLLTATPVNYGLAAGDATAVAAVVGPFKTAYDAAADPGTRTAALVAAKDSAKDAMLPVLREYYAMIQGDRSVSDAHKVGIGVLIPHARENLC